MKSKELENMIFNPIYTSLIIHHFLSGFKSKNKNGIKTELIFVVLPIIYNQELSNKLSNLNTNSKLTPLIENKEYESFFSQINSKINDYKKITKHSLIVLSSNNNLEINEYLNIGVFLDYKNEEDLNIRNIFKSAYNLGILLAKENYLTIIKKLRINEL
jgi:hypothetical protein